MNKDKKHDFIIIGFLFLLVIIIRLPSFFYSVFDWDESTFILMGQSILDGNIPYVEAWDNKPPFAYFIYSMFIYFFGKTIFAIRVGGMLFVFLASVLLYMTGEALYNKTAGVIAAIFLIVFVSARKWGLSTMIEHLMLVPVSLVLLLVLTRKLDNKMAFVTGLILGAGILMRQNMAFDSLAVLAVFLTGITMPGTDIPERFNRCIFLISGIFVPIFAVIVYYVLNGELRLFINTNISVAIAHVSESTSIYRKFELLFTNIKREFADGNILLWLCFPHGILSIFFFQKNKDIKRAVVAMLIIFLAQVFSIFYTGTIFGYHYLGLITPIMALVCGVAISFWFSSGAGRVMAVKFIAVFIIAAGLIFSLHKHVYPLYREIASKVMLRQPLDDDTCYQIAEYLNKENVKGKYIYLLNNCHIVYFLTDSRLPTKYVHPTNIIKYDYMLKVIDGPEATDETELQKILLKKPAFIVYKDGSWPTPDDDFRKMLFIELDKQYRLVKVINDDHFIYRRKRS